MPFSYRDPLAPIAAFFPPWLQIILFGYLGVVLMQWAMEKQQERNGLFLFVVYLVTGTFCVLRAAALLVAHL